MTIFYPVGSLISSRNTSSGSYVQTTISTNPNTILYMDSSSTISSISASTLDLNVSTASWAALALTASYAPSSPSISSSYANQASSMSISSNDTLGTLYYLMLATGSSGQSPVYVDTVDLIYNQATSVVTLTNLSASATVISGSATKNPLSVIGNNNSYCEITNQNVSSGNVASSDIVATADIGNDSSYYIDFGINSSMYNTAQVGNALDSYLYATGSNSSSLYIGHTDVSGSVHIFAGGVVNTGSGIIISGQTISTNLPLIASAFIVSSSNTLQPIFVSSNLNNELEAIVQNYSTGTTASSDFVAVNASGSYLTANYVDLGINGPGYGIPQFIGGPNDAYLFTTGSNFYIGNITPNQSLSLFSGGTLTTASLTIAGTGNVGINITNPINALDVVGNISCSVITASAIVGVNLVTNALSIAYAVALG